MRKRISNTALKNASVTQLLKILEEMDLHIIKNVPRGQNPAEVLDRSFQEDHAWVQYHYQLKAEANVEAFKKLEKTQQAA